MPEEIHGEPMQEGDTDSQNSVDAVSPPRSRDNLSSTNNYGASIVTPMAHSYDTRNTKRDVEYSPLYPYMSFCVLLRITCVYVSCWNMACGEPKFIVEYVP